MIPKRQFPRPLAILALGLAVFTAGCEVGPKQSTQAGFRGTGTEQVTTTAKLSALRAANVVPEPPYELDASAPPGPRATEVYENVQVLTDVSQEEFDRLMQAITAWVSPEQGCNYCHNPENLASDEVYTKVVARKMLQMTRTINTQWQPHVAKTGVTCWTCHRGNPVPVNVWSTDMNDPKVATRERSRLYQNNPVASVNYSTLPHDPYTPYFVDDQNIRIQGTQALPYDHRVSIRKTEQNYALMIHMSQGLGVNCTFCHNSGAFANWAKSSPQRVTAWHGIRMTRDINNVYMVPITNVFPPNRLGPKGDVLKVNCTTCHQGVNKPMYGVSMIPDFPELARNPASAAPTPPLSEDSGATPPLPTTAPDAPAPATAPANATPTTTPTE